MSRSIKPRVATLITALAACALLIFVTTLITAAPAYAQGPTTTPPAGAQLFTNVRARQFKREQTLYNAEIKRLADAGKVATKTRDYIDAQNALGKDTSTLVAALAAFKAQIASAQSSDDAANTLITAHAGFDDSGAVTDLALAAQTVKDIRQPLLDAHRSLRQAVVDLRNAIRTYRKANSTA